MSKPENEFSQSHIAETTNKWYWNTNSMNKKMTSWLMIFVPGLPKGGPKRCENELKKTFAKISPKRKASWMHFHNHHRIEKGTRIQTIFVSLLTIWKLFFFADFWRDWSWLLVSYIGSRLFLGATVDGRNPAPTGMYKTPVNDGIFTISTGVGFLPSTVWALRSWV